MCHSRLLGSLSKKDEEKTDDEDGKVCGECTEEAKELTSGESPSSLTNQGVWNPGNVPAPLQAHSKAEQNKGGDESCRGGGGGGEVGSRGRGGKRRREGGQEESRNISSYPVCCCSRNDSHSIIPNNPEEQNVLSREQKQVCDKACECHGKTFLTHLK